MIFSHDINVIVIFNACGTDATRHKFQYFRKRGRRRYICIITSLDSHAQDDAGITFLSSGLDEKAEDCVS